MLICANLENLVTERDLRLSILDPDPTHRHGILTMHREGLSSARYTALLEPCGRPTCSCCNINFKCSPVTIEAGVVSPVKSMEFWLDVRERTVLAAELKHDPESLSLAEAVRSAMTHDDWKRLYHWFRLSKLEVIHEASASAIDLSDLPDASTGLMVPFSEVFPWGLDLYFRIGTEIWVAAEQYCVQPKCNCQQMVLSFLKAQDESGRKKAFPKILPAIRYYYSAEATETVSASETGNPSVTELFEAVKREHTDLSLKLKFRHNFLQAVYQRSYVETAKSKLKFASTSSSKTVSRKIGRNEPCPCRSGKKYKHCCLQKR